jgi:glycosyltransferase involved in cell wall biosynthesis
MKNGSTIGIPVYNEKDRIERSIRSAAPQCEKLIVSDNASSDGTGPVCEALADEIPNMEYIRNPVNIGAKDNWFQILENTSTPYLMYLGSHDYIDNNYCAPALDKLEEDKTLEIVTGELINIAQMMHIQYIETF